MYAFIIGKCILLSFQIHFHADMIENSRKQHISVWKAAFQKSCKKEVLVTMVWKKCKYNDIEIPLSILGSCETETSEIFLISVITPDAFSYSNNGFG